MRRPAAITGIGWLFVAVGAVGLLRRLWPLLARDRLAGAPAEGPAELAAALASSLLAIAGGAGLLRGREWARWLLAAWMLFHLGLSLVHSLEELLVHVVLFAPLLYALFRRASGARVHAEEAAP